MRTEPPDYKNADVAKSAVENAQREEESKKSPLEKLLDVLSEWGGLDKDLAI